MPSIFWNVRNGTSDQSIINSTAINDEYGLRDLPPLGGFALDIGAHIGSVCIPLALAHPHLTVLAVEALPANVEVLRKNVEANGLSDRVIIFGAALTRHDGDTQVFGDFLSAEGLDDDYVHTNRFIGNVIRTANHPRWDATAFDVKAITLSTLLAEIPEVVFTKVDCEGCEWPMFADPAIRRLAYIVGEYHDKTEDDLYEALYRTHEVTTFPAGVAIGMFMAELRDEEVIEAEDVDAFDPAEWAEVA